MVRVSATRLVFTGTTPTPLTVLAASTSTFTKAGVLNHTQMLPSTTPTTELPADVPAASKLRVVATGTGEPQG